MQVLGIATGPAVDTDAVLEPIREALEERGSVGVVRHGDAGADRTTYVLGDGGWKASGSDLSPSEALDRLARSHEYGLLVGFPTSRVPQLAVGDVEVENPVITAENEEGVDLEEVLEAVESVEPFETLETLVRRVKASPDAEYAGAIATFTGRVRAKEDPDDEFTEFLSFERYEGVAEERMAAIEAELTDRDGVYEVEMHHRTGRIEYGEDIVFVVVLAGHRGEAFETVEDGIDRLKEEVPIFKKEKTIAEEFWVHERS